MRRRKYYYLIPVIVGLILFFQSCNDAGIGIVTKNNPKRIQLNYSKADSSEAKEFALWLSGKLQPADSLVSELLYNLNYIRYRFGDSIRYQDSILILRTRQFMAPWLPSMIYVKFDDSAALKVNNGEYHEWVRLPEYIRPKGNIHLSYGGIDLRFSGYFHPRRLAELYKTLPGVIGVSIESWMFVGGPNYPIYPRKVGNDITYLFTVGQYGFLGHCWYFKYVNGVLYYIGDWKPTDPEPSWWSEARYNAWYFDTWDG
jgi:hypothetical protein